MWAPAYHVEDLVSATGSGDSSLAGFTAAFLRGESPERCVAAGNALGYQNLHALDAISGIKDWKATLEIMADTSLPRKSYEPEKGWRFDQHRRIGWGPNDRK